MSRFNDRLEQYKQSEREEAIKKDSRERVWEYLFEHEFRPFIQEETVALPCIPEVAITYNYQGVYLDYIVLEKAQMRPVLLYLKLLGKDFGEITTPSANSQYYTISYHLRVNKIREIHVFTGMVPHYDFMYLELRFMPAENANCVLKKVAEVNHEYKTETFSFECRKGSDW